MRSLAIVVCLALAILPRIGGAARAADRNDLVAIDVLLLPDDAMAAKARAANAKLRQDYPAGFALDATHTPHLTLLQCYVRIADVAATVGAVQRVFRKTPPAGMTLTATGFFNSRVADVSATGISVRVTPRLARLQRDVVAAATPFITHGGTAMAFVDAPRSATIGWTATYVDRFLTDSSGPKFSPHVTAGVGRPGHVARLATAPFTAFSFEIEAAGVYQLGDIGTARKRLWVWRPD